MRIRCSGSRSPQTMLKGHAQPGLLEHALRAQGVQAACTTATGPAGIVNAAPAPHLTVNSAGGRDVIYRWFCDRCPHRQQAEIH